MKYAYHDGTAWHTETVDNDGNVGHYNSLALDTAGRPHISYYDFTDHDLKYARYDGIGWQIEIVDPEVGWISGHTSLVLDESDHAHISYQAEVYSNYFRPSNTLRHAYHNGIVRQIEEVDGDGDVGWYTSLALDKADQPHISYLDVIHGDLKYAWYDGTGWISETVDSDGTVGFYTSLALDSADQPHIGYHDLFAGDLKYARYDGTGWVIETVDSDGTVGRYLSLALDSSNHPHIGYQGYNDLKYAHFDGTSWQIETVDGSGDMGSDPSLILDQSNFPHISYCSGNELNYACYNGTGWITETVDIACYYSSLALDFQGYPHIVYGAWAGNPHREWNVAIGHLGLAAPWPNSILKYAYYDGSSWHLEIVDDSEYVGAYASLSLDADDRPHIGYYDYALGSLKYAYRSGSAWHIQTVDSAGNVGRNAFLDLDSTGRPHISYYDSTNRDLKYAHAEVWPYSFYLPIVVHNIVQH